MTRLLVSAIAGYSRWISPLTPPTCRYAPSCAAYAAESLQTHGLLAGGWLAVRRLLRCHPWTPGGFDPVPRRPSPLAGQPTSTSTTSA